MELDVGVHIDLWHTEREKNLCDLKRRDQSFRVKFARSDSLSLSGKLGNELSLETGGSLASAGEAAVVHTWQQLRHGQLDQNVSTACSPKAEEHYFLQLGNKALTGPMFGNWQHPGQNTK